MNEPMSSRRQLLSVVCPAYEEEQVLPAFHEALRAAIRPLESSLDLEIIYVDDGSRDRTFAVVQDLAARDPRVRGLSLSRNFGHQAALTAGLEHAHGDAVVMLDSDMQHPPALIPLLVEKWRAGFEVVQTIREEDRGLGWFKRRSSSCFYQLLRRWSTIEIRPAAADFRLLSRPALDALLEMRESHRFVRGMVQWLGFRVAEIPFKPERRGAGASKYTLRKMLRLAFDGLCSFSRAPLWMTVAAGLTATGISLVTSLVFAFSKGAGLGLAAVLVAGHAVLATLFAAIGVLGEYVGRNYEESKRRPLYVIKARTPIDRASSRSAA